MNKRLVRSGELFTSEELDRGEVELERVGPLPEPPEKDQAEPWGTRLEDDPRFRDRLRAYREFLEGLETEDYK